MERHYTGEVMAPHEVVSIVSLLLKYLPKDQAAAFLRDARPITIDKEYQHVLTRLENELAGR